MNKNYYAVLMAGGVGSRFWPVSTQKFPKQFHDMLGTGETLIQRTFNRLSKIIPKENILILTNAAYNDLVLEQLPGIQQDQVILEPAMRNTAPCILYASLKIQKENPNALIIVAPSDQWIEDEDSFAKNVLHAFDFCKKNDALMTFGIRPTFPNTGYGNIEFDVTGNEVLENTNIEAVNQFKEKPDYQTARTYVEQGNYMWNAGIFIWSVDSIVKAFENHQPDMMTLFNKGLSVYNSEFEDDFIRDNYALADNISIDYAVMEKSTNVFVLPADFDWTDLGSWGSLYDKLEKDENNNVVVNSGLWSKDISGNIIRTDNEKVVVVEGLNDFIIVDKDDVLLIFPKEKEQDLKQVRQKVRDKFGDNYI